MLKSWLRLHIFDMSLVKRSSLLLIHDSVGPCLAWPSRARHVTRPVKITILFGPRSPIRGRHWHARNATATPCLMLTTTARAGRGVGRVSHSHCRIQPTQCRLIAHGKTHESFTHPRIKLFFLLLLWAPTWIGFLIRFSRTVQPKAFETNGFVKSN